ncbi:MAG: hypothetical protein EOM46_12210 [Gammaproteobacteria bacterium]|nr:hypothetical protein [Gammaproteobacteria bacterium]
MIHQNEVIHENTRRKYPAEFKQEAVALVQQSSQSISQIASSLGINENILRRWIKKLSLSHHHNVVVMALANKKARILWALLTINDAYRAS